MNPDSGYKRILLAKAPLKIKLAALERMEKPSLSFLSTLVRNPDTPPKLRLAAADRLKELQRKREIDKLLQTERNRLGEGS